MRMGQGAVTITLAFDRQETCEGGALYTFTAMSRLEIYPISGPSAGGTTISIEGATFPSTAVACMVGLLAVRADIPQRVIRE